MAYKIDRVDVWAGDLKDRPGGLSEKLAPLSDAGAALEFVFARRAGKKKGVVFLAPIKGAKQVKAAKASGVKKAPDLGALRIVGPDKKGLGAKLTKALAKAGINLRGVSATAVGRRCVCYLAFDKKQDAGKAKRVLAKAL